MTAPDWLTGVPEQAAVFPLLLIAATWSLRIYTEEADQVFLLQNVWLSRGLKKWGIAHSLGKGVMVTALGLGFVLPFLVTGWGWGLERHSALSSSGELECKNVSVFYRSVCAFYLGEMGAGGSDEPAFCCHSSFDEPGRLDV